MTSKGLSDKAHKNLRRNAELRASRRRNQNKILVLMDGEEVIRIFNPEQIEPQEIDYDGNGEKVQKFDYIIMDPNTGEADTFRVGIKTSGDIDALLTEHRLFKDKKGGFRQISHQILCHSCARIIDFLTQFMMQTFFRNSFRKLNCILFLSISNDTLMTMTGYMLSSLDSLKEDYRRSFE